MADWEHAKIAREHFRKGDRVKLSDVGRASHLGNHGEHQLRGTVVGYARSAFSMRVRPDGRKTPSTYWAGFWERNRGTRRVKGTRLKGAP